MWDGDDLVHERVVRGDDIDPVVTWLFEPGTFAPAAKFDGKKRYSVVNDHLGSPNALYTEAREIAWKAQLDIYGVPREDRRGIAEGNATGNPRRYPGQYEDAETGLYYNRFRYYDPETGRYISEDPIGLAGGTALYGYVHDPLGWVDPWALAYFRGARPGEAPTFTFRPNEVRVDKITNLVRDSHGVSLFNNPHVLKKKGLAPFELIESSIPDSLQVIQRGGNPNHFEIGTCQRV